MPPDRLDMRASDGRAQHSTEPPPSLEVAGQPGAVLDRADFPYALLLGSAMLLFPLWRLYRRLSPQDVLRVDRRRKVLACVTDRPGITAGGVARRLRVRRFGVLHHLQVLVEFGLVEARTVGPRNRYYARAQALTEAAKNVEAALGTASARRVAAHLLRDPSASLGAMAKATGVPKSTVRWHADRFEDLGLLSDQGGFRAEILDALATGLQRRAGPEA
jgi:predicted transcriptional regulator